MIVEFIGTPGSGKTTLLRTAANYFLASGLRPYTVIEASRVFASRTVPGKAVQLLLPHSLRQKLLWQVFYQLSRFQQLRFKHQHQELIRLVDRWQSERPADASTPGRRVEFWWGQLAGYYAFLSSHIQVDEVLLLDEGFVHRVVQLFASPTEHPSQEKIVAYAGLIPQPDLVIYTIAPVEVCLQRILDRGVWPRMQGLTSYELRQFIMNAAQAVSFMSAQLKADGWNLIEIDNSSPDFINAQQELFAKLSQAGYLENESQVPATLQQQVSTI